MTWKIKIDSETKAPVIDEQGKITYIDPDGKELPLDPPAMYQKISQLGKENQNHRKKYEDVLNTLKPFEGVEDIATWKEEADKALETVKNFNDKDWMKAEKVEALKKEMAQAYEEKLKKKDLSYAEKEKLYATEKDKLSNQIRRLLVSNKFAVSKYFSGGGDSSVTILPSQIAEDHFGKYFKVEEGSDGMPVIRAFYSNGDPIISKINPGDNADFEEAIGLIIDQYPGKETILRSTSGGSGGGGGGGADDHKESGDIASLRKQYSQAQQEGNARLAITLKNRIFELEKAKRVA